MKKLYIILIVVIIAIIIAIIYYKKNKETFINDDLTRGQQYSPNDKILFKEGVPRSLPFGRTLIKPSQIGFSKNNYIDRDTYSDIYNGDGERRQNPVFRYVTHAKGYEVFPARFSEPDYKFYGL
jgi:hypothetical protein